MSTTTTTKLDDYQLLQKINYQLNHAILMKDKQWILSIYDAAKAIDFDALQTSGHTTILGEYDVLVDLCNDILGESL